MHLLAKFGEPSFDISKVIVQTSPFFGDFETFTSNDLEGHDRADKHIFLLILTQNDIESQGQIPTYTIPTEIYL